MKGGSKQRAQNATFHPAAHHVIGWFKQMDRKTPWLLNEACDDDDDDDGD